MSYTLEHLSGLSTGFGIVSVWLLVVFAVLLIIYLWVRDSSLCWRIKSLTFFLLIGTTILLFTTFSVGMWAEYKIAWHPETLCQESGCWEQRHRERVREFRQG